ncbi:hypothetical protein [Nostoc sp.]|uniref:hypothetical protein n=1 Tax=Nostoc sp. TaxID=1180 RepID=UPI002FF78DD3
MIVGAHSRASLSIQEVVGQDLLPLRYPYPALSQRQILTPALLTYHASHSLIAMAFVGIGAKYQIFPVEAKYK